MNNKQVLEQFLYGSIRSYVMVLAKFIFNGVIKKCVL